MFISLMLVLMYVLLLIILGLKQEVSSLRDEAIFLKKDSMEYMRYYCLHTKGSTDETWKKMHQYKNDIRRSYGG